jgi:hypothetical protein
MVARPGRPPGAGGPTDSLGVVNRPSPYSPSDAADVSNRFRAHRSNSSTNVVQADLGAIIRHVNMMGITSLDTDKVVVAINVKTVPDRTVPDRTSPDHRSHRAI